MSPIEKIDSILTLLAQDAVLRPFAKEDEIFASYLNKHPETIESTFEGSVVKSILDKLTDDKHIKPVEFEIWSEHRGLSHTITKYTITFEGSLFHQQGGYQAQLNRQNAENNRVTELEKFQKANASRMTYLTTVLAVFSLISAFLMSLDKFHVIFRIDIWLAFFLFCSGILVGLCIWLILQHLSRQKNNK